MDFDSDLSSEFRASFFSVEFGTYALLLASNLIIATVYRDEELEDNFDAILYFLNIGVGTALLAMRVLLTFKCVRMNT